MIKELPSDFHRNYNLTLISSMFTSHFLSSGFARPVFAPNSFFSFSFHFFFSFSFVLQFFLGGVGTTADAYNVNFMDPNAFQLLKKNPTNVVFFKLSCLPIVSVR